MYRRSLVRSQSAKAEALSRSRPARTPPSTFLFLHLHLSNSPEPEAPNPDFDFHPTTNDNRQLSAACALIVVRSVKDALPRLDQGQDRAALSGRVISPPLDACQRCCQQIVATHPRNPKPREVLIYQALAPHLSHIPATFCSSDMSRPGEIKHLFRGRGARIRTTWMIHRASGRARYRPDARHD